jgi:hypothetical protein
MIKCMERANLSMIRVELTLYVTFGKEHGRKDKKKEALMFGLEAIFPVIKLLTNTKAEHIKMVELKLMILMK